MFGSTAPVGSVLRCGVLCRYGLTAEQESEAEAAYEQMLAAVDAKRAAAAAEQQQHQALPPDCNMLGECSAHSSALITV
jgi:hypothetical protein